MVGVCVHIPLLFEVLINWLVAQFCHNVIVQQPCKSRKSYKCIEGNSCGVLWHVMYQTVGYELIHLAEKHSICYKDTVSISQVMCNGIAQ